jgi:hypothetical protein
MSGILNCSFDTIVLKGKIMFYLATGAVLMSALYLVYSSVYWSGIGKDTNWKENDSALTRNLLPQLIRNGFLIIFSGLILGIVLLLLEWNNVLLLLAVVPVLFGLMVLFFAWHIRQGLLYGGFVRFAIGLLKLPRKVHQLFLFQLFFLITLFVSLINPIQVSPVFQSIGIFGSTFLIAALSIAMMLTLKKLKND